jgi:RNA polymerase sigma-70 factor (ECF subfamily)
MKLARLQSVLIHRGYPGMLAYLSPPPKKQSAPASMAESDQALARQAQHDPDAFAELYHRYVARIYRYHLARTGDPDDAQDLTSKTFLAALESIRTYRGSATFLGWLFGIASHKVTDHYRGQRHNLPLENADDVLDPQASLDDVAWQHQRLALISQTLLTLSPERAEALVLRIFTGMSAAEVGQVMGKNETAVRMLVHRGLRDLNKKLATPEEVEL